MADTAKTIIEAAMRKLGVQRRGMTLSAEDEESGLEALNRMIDTWALDNLLIYAETLNGFALVSGKGEYTISDTGADFTATRPESISFAHVRDSSGYDHGVELITQDQYMSITNKAAPGRPTKLYYDPQHPKGLIKLWPVPSSVETLWLSMLAPLSGYANGAGSVDLPPGYKDALVYNLAVKLAPEYGVDTPQEVLAQAHQLKQKIKNRNSKPSTFRHDTALMNIGGRGRGGNIFTG